jgi:hypothetical protein
MNPNLRLGIALIAGAIAAFITIALIETAAHTVYPSPPGLDYSNPDALRHYVTALPVGAKLAVLAAWLFGTIDGAFVACLINKGRYGLCAGIVGGLVLAATIANLMFIPHPLWLAGAGIAGIPLAAFLVSRLMPHLFRPA